MYAKSSTVAGVLAALLCLVIGHAQSAPSGTADWIGKRLSSRRTSFFYGTPRVGRSTGARPRYSAAPVSSLVASQPGHPLEIQTHFSEGGGLLPTWTYNIRASRDGLQYQGSVVGHSPFGKLGTDRIPTFIVPLVTRTHRIAASLDTTTFDFKIIDGDTTVDPTAPDHNCLPAPNNVPATVVQQSPLFTPTRFVFGGTDVGTTQYLDAHQRASFWNVLGAKADDYHVLLDPVRITPVFLDVPPNEGLSINDPHILDAFGVSICTPIQIINMAWLDTYLDQTVIPALAQEGVNAAALPIFLLYNSFVQDDVTNLLAPGALGYHSFTGLPFGTNPYIVADFDRSNLFLGPSDGLGTEILSHEIGEWGNDPYLINVTPSWGNTGQVVACQWNLEVGDPLSATARPDTTMPNGLSYHLQELAFFSWFYGAPSPAVNGWYSNNDTFKTDAGHVCP